MNRIIWFLWRENAYGLTRKLPLTADKLALVVGISQYRSWNTLPFADEDARDVYKALTKVYGFPRGNVKLLANRKTTKREIIAGLDWLESNADSDDIVVMYISAKRSVDALLSK